MIEFHSLTKFNLNDESALAKWIEFSIHQENKVLGELNYIFCDDHYLVDKNIKYLKHNTLTDIISFDYSIDNIISGDVFISVERVIENAKDLNIVFTDELHRVMIHGVMHYCGYSDKLKKELKLMRSKEDYYLSLRTF